MKRDLQTVLMDGLYALHVFLQKFDIDVKRIKVTIEFEDMNTYSRTQSAAFHEFGRAPTTALAIQSDPMGTSPQSPIIGAFRSGREFTIWGMRFLIKPPTRDEYLPACNCEDCQRLRRIARS